jgi:NADH-quinone oxidoreductase subunit L
VAVALASLAVAYLRYAKNNHVPVADAEKRAPLTKLSYNKFYIDELYASLFTRPLDALSGFFYKVLDRSGIDGIVNGLGRGAVEASKGLRLLQSGMVGFYIFMMVAGMIALLLYAIYKV